LFAKPTGIVSMGATLHHFLGADRHLRDVLAFYGALVAPVSVYLTSSDFVDGVPSVASAREPRRPSRAAHYELLRCPRPVPARSSQLADRSRPACRGRRSAARLPMRIVSKTATPGSWVSRLRKRPYLGRFACKAAVFVRAQSSADDTHESARNRLFS
jgi:hypothetical protein